MIQPLSYVHPNSKIAENVVIDPFVTIEKNVEIGSGTWIGSNVTIMEGAIIGKNCKIFPGAVISAPPQDLKYNGNKHILTLEITPQSENVLLLTEEHNQKEKLLLEKMYLLWPIHI